MFDLHAHILPGLDDGPVEWDTAVEMMRVAASDGIKGIAATPHVSPGVYDNAKDAVLALAEELRKRAGGLQPMVYTGSEVAVSPESLEGIRQNKYCTLNNSRYVLLELPGHFSPEAVYEFLFSITGMGFVPIIAHPERNPRVQSNLETLHEMVRLGAMAQVTAGSLTGQFGAVAKKLARDMLGRRLSHIIASDAHNAGSRAPSLSAGLREAVKIIGEPDAKAMVSGVPAKVLKDEPVEVPEPVHVRKRKFFF